MTKHVTVNAGVGCTTPDKFNNIVGVHKAHKFTLYRFLSIYAAILIAITNSL